MEEIRLFSPENQRTMGHGAEAVILPAKEAVLRQKDLSGIVGRIRQRAVELELPVTYVRKMVDRIKNQGIFPGIEALIPLIYPKLDSLFDYAGKSAVFVFIQPAEIKAEIEAGFRRGEPAVRGSPAVGPVVRVAPGPV